ncbi:LacI family transcriptional regulator [Mycetocola tolaasinivorans]|uniref:LacI family transcriptional regulator n=1 Tax=Mycetocola tolaasinivorans TaxID=76635 RepID=A0A3L7A3C8_9MICO|nr:LacI family DNA-binding transcriptional regulator [Mycetocola tolaasinivorans]RLP74555.1 LacI family transcriptional regulator [Mycetocola tolaasinivorans]
MPSQRPERSTTKRGSATRSRLTSRDIALAAGVSQATVSNVLNRPEIVAPETLKRVNDVIESMNFVVNDSARTLRAGHSRALGVIALDLSNPFWGEVTRGIEATASQLGYSVLLGSSEEKLDKETRLLRLFEENRVEGILVSSVDIGSETLATLYEHGMKVVLLDQPDPAGTYSSVSLDQVQGARLAAQHLLEQGHRRIAFINIPHSVSWSRDRLQGLSEGIAAAGLDPAEVITEITIESMTAHAAEPAVETLLAGSPDVTAVLCANDMVALGVLKQLSERGVTVPRDLSVVGFDDSYFASMLSPALTTVRQHPFELGQTAAEMIIKATDGVVPESVLFDPELIVRQSVRNLTSAAG